MSEIKPDETQPDEFGLVEEDLPPISNKKWLLIAVLVCVVSLIPVLIFVFNPPEAEQKTSAETQTAPAENKLEKSN